MIITTATQPPAAIAEIKAFVPAIIALTAATVALAAAFIVATVALAVAFAACAAVLNDYVENGICLLSVIINRNRIFPRLFQTASAQIIFEQIQGKPLNIRKKIRRIDGRLLAGLCMYINIRPGILIKHELFIRPLPLKSQKKKDENQNPAVYGKSESVSFHSLLLSLSLLFFCGTVFLPYCLFCR